MNEQLYYILRHESEEGPFTLGQLRSMWAQGHLTVKSSYRAEGEENWQSMHLMAAALEGDRMPQPLPSISQEEEAAPQLKNSKTKSRAGCGCLTLIIIYFAVLLISGNKNEPSSLQNPVMANKSAEDSRMREKYPPIVVEDATASNTTRIPDIQHKASASKERSISWEEIDGFYNLEGNTKLSKAEKWKDYKGKSVRWTGTVASLSERLFGGLSLQVKMNRRTLISDVVISLKKGQNDKALQYKEGQTITFTGILDDWGDFIGIALKEGIIESP